MASILSLSSFQEYQSHHPLTKIREKLESLEQAIRIEIRTAPSEEKATLLKLKNELQEVNLLNDKTVDFLTQFIENFSSKLKENGFEDVVKNSDKYKHSNLEVNDDIEGVFKKVKTFITHDLKESLQYSSSEFHDIYSKVDNAYYEYHKLSTFREIHSVFSNLELNYKQRFAFVLGTFLTNLPANTQHFFKYLQSLGQTTKTYLAHCQINECETGSINNVCEGVSMALGYAIGATLHQNLMQNANVNYLMLTDPNLLESDIHKEIIGDSDLDTDHIDDKLKRMPKYLLSLDSAISILNNKDTEVIIKALFDIDSLDDILTLPNAVNLSRVLDFLIPRTVGYDFFPIDYDDLQGELSNEYFTRLTLASALHTIISLLIVQFPSETRK